MPLSNLVYTGGQAPNNTAAGIHVASTRPDPYGSFQQGYKDQQENQARKIANDKALQDYRQAVIKADLANAMYPDLLAAQQAQLKARIAGYNSPPADYTSRLGGGPNPVDTTRTPVTTPAGTPSAAAPAAGGQPLTLAPAPQSVGNLPPGLGQFDPNANQIDATPRGLFTPQPQPMIPGLADASQFSSGDFGGGGLGDLAGIFG